MSTILITIGVITGITTLLALLLTFADAFIADYGIKKILINKNKELEIEGGNTLLSTLVNEKIFIPSACGGKGSCGYCKCKVNSGGGPVLATELPYLSKGDKENNIRLSCQIKVKEDMEIEIPEELFNVKAYKGVVEEIVDITDKIKFVRFKITSNDPSTIDFNAGQYIQLTAPPYPSSPEEVYRAYSIASATKDKNHINLLIGYVEDGLLTTYVHQHLNQGSSVNFTGPYGDFYLQDTDAEIVLVAVGTGMAPILSILYELIDQKSQRKATFFFGARTKSDLFMLEEMDIFERELPNFKFIPTLSRPNAEEEWTGEVGRVNNSIEKILEYSDAPREAYLCGSAPMIDSTVDSLLAKGIREDKIYFDKFD
ncbi:NADH:ubiquinone reductase (Na(+)-transporting) subunit F [Alkaliphilus hydrothermalis]|uniref:Na+-transporting NADH:ubiquinone oxidoreductase subunit F n=1 Tax=Alkaliphilus hydrothermalis TaxID=1482730 RepID=A0ABS2NPM0_9FIRM|nr:2Fe-2S iron-sulfur cluster binding domain-containing protein [Alkaliphilus hydrothermalis]MBM7614894.1 Na+-transporting NADH:ubiquinone oxidoreductase subunit F [Alkaliphilus hydrothermalis]